MKRLIALTALLAAVAVPTVAFGDLIGDDLKVSDHGTTAQVQLNYFYSGLGSQTATITVSAPFTCTNNGGNQPPGQISGSSGPITPDHGNVSGTITTAAASCPDHMAPLIGPTVTVVVTKADGTSTVFTYTV